MDSLSLVVVVTFKQGSLISSILLVFLRALRPLVKVINIILLNIP